MTISENELKHIVSFLKLLRYQKSPSRAGEKQFFAKKHVMKVTFSQNGKPLNWCSHAGESYIFDFSLLNFGETEEQPRKPLFEGCLERERYFQRI